MPQLPAEVVEVDHKLDAKASKASEELCRHRWHWTLDETNPERVSIRAYARRVGKNESKVRSMVNGYAEWINAPGAGRSLNEYIERAKMGVEKAAVTDAVAQARGVSFGQTRRTRNDEVKRVRTIAQERAEKHGTSVEEEAPKVAAWTVKAEQSSKTRCAAASRVCPSYSEYWRESDEAS